MWQFDELARHEKTSASFQNGSFLGSHNSNVVVLNRRMDLTISRLEATLSHRRSEINLLGSRSLSENALRIAGKSPIGNETFPASQYPRHSMKCVPCMTTSCPSWEPSQVFPVGWLKPPGAYAGRNGAAYDMNNSLTVTRLKTRSHKRRKLH